MKDYRERFRERFGKLAFIISDKRDPTLGEDSITEILAFIDELVPGERAKASDLAFDRGQRWERTALIEWAISPQGATAIDTSGRRFIDLDDLLTYLRADKEPHHFKDASELAKDVADQNKKQNMA